MYSFSPPCPKIKITEPSFIGQLGYDVTYSLVISELWLSVTDIKDINSQT